MFEVIGARAAGSIGCDIDPRVLDALASKIYNVALVQRPAREFITELKSTLVKAPLETQQRWIEVLRRRIVQDRSPHTCSSCEYSSHMNLMLDASGSDVCPTCRASAVEPLDLLVSPTLHSKEELQRRGIARGDNCAARMVESFSKLCEVSNRIVLVDRFVVADALRADGSSPGSSGLQKFLKLADDSGVSFIEIHTAAGFSFSGSAVRASEIPALLRTLTDPLGLRHVSIELVVQSKRDGQREIHDRSLAFLWSPPVGGVSWFLGNGLSQFDGVLASRDHDLGRKSHGQMMQMVGRLPGSAQLRVRVV